MSYHCSICQECVTQGTPLKRHTEYREVLGRKQIAREWAVCDECHEMLQSTPLALVQRQRGQPSRAKVQTVVYGEPRPVRPAKPYSGPVKQPSKPLIATLKPGSNVLAVNDDAPASYKAKTPPPALKPQMRKGSRHNGKPKPPKSIKATRHEQMVEAMMAEITPDPTPVEQPKPLIVGYTEMI